MKKGFLILILAFVLLSSFAIADLTTNGVAYYQHDNATISGTKSIDSTNHYNGTITGATIMTPGILNDALDFSGTNQYVTMNPTMGGGVGSVNIWYNADTTGNNQQLFYRATVAGYWGMAYRSGTGNVLYRCGGGASINSDDIATTQKWAMITLVCDGTNGLLYFNGTLVHNTTTAHGIDNTQLMYLGVAGAGLGDDYNGKMDEVFITDDILTPSEVNELWNSGTGFNPYTVIPAVITPVADLIFRNSTDDITTSFDEGEDFTTYLNYTLSNGSIVTNETASCNISFVDGIGEDSAANTNFTICNTGCDFITYTEELDLHDTTNAVTDFARFNACHEQTLSGDIDVTFACGALTNTTTVDATDFPLCGEGSSRLTVYDKTCIGSDNVNISVSATVPNSQRKRITDLEVDREFSLHTETALFNLTSSLWYISLTHEYYEHGNKTIYANCTEPTYSINHSEEITIVNLAPRIVFSGVRTSLGFTTGANNMVIEYASGIWNWSGTVTDNDLDHFNVSIYNSTGGLMINWTDLTNNTVLQTPDEMFVDFVDEGNPYSINVTAIDTQNATTNLSAFFYVNDTTAPVCSFANDTQLKDTTYNFDITCTDEHFYSLNVTCDNSFSFFVEGLNTQSYNFVNSTSIVDSVVTCTAEYCDGHTNAKLNKVWSAFTEESAITIYTDGEKIAKVWTEEPNGVVTYNVLTDRLTYNFDMSLSSKEKFTFYVNTSTNTNYLDSDKYLGWLVIDNHYWLDFNSNQLDEDDKVKVTDLGNGLFQIDIKIKNKIITFESIGELNCVEKNFTITPYDPYINCSYNPAPYLRQGIGINERDLNPVLCNIIGGDTKTFKCTSTITFNGSLVQTNPEPLEYKDGIASLIYNTRTIGYFTAKPELNTTQNFLAYFTNKKLQAERSATLSVNCFNGNEILNWNASITPTYKDMFTTMDTAIQVSKSPVYWIMSILFFGGIIGLLLWLINKAKQLKNGTY